MRTRNRLLSVLLPVVAAFALATLSAPVASARRPPPAPDYLNIGDPDGFPLKTESHGGSPLVSADAAKASRPIQLTPTAAYSAPLRAAPLDLGQLSQILLMHFLAKM